MEQLLLWDSYEFIKHRLFLQIQCKIQNKRSCGVKKENREKFIDSPDFLIFDREFVIISDLLPDSYWLLRVDHDLVLPINLDDFGVAVWLQNKVGK